MISCALMGCASYSNRSAGIWNETGPNTSGDTRSRSQVLIASGVEFLQNGEYDKAQKVFNTALKFDLQSAPLHFFNALTYQIRYEKGDADSYALAEAGLRTAIDLDPTLDLAHLQLGRLYMRSKNYGSAQKAFALAVDAKQKAPQEALYGLAQAALLSGDISTSLWATAQLDGLNWKDARLFRMKAFHAAMANKPQIAAQMLSQYAVMEANKQEVRYVGSRVDQLLAVNTTFSPEKNTDAVVQAQAIANGAKRESPEAEEKKTESVASEQRKNWFRCDIRPGPVQEKDTVSIHPPLTLPASEENFTAPTLPAPCEGEVPPVAMIEITMIRTEETVQKSYGINLIDGLSLAKKVSRQVDGSLTRSATNFFNANAGPEISVDSGFLSYSLNIANSLFTKNEVIARPPWLPLIDFPRCFSVVPPTRSRWAV